MPNRRAMIVILAVHILAGLLFLAPSYIRPDSIATYEYLRSAVFDGDFAFFNEWASAGLFTPDRVTYFSEVSPNGALSNHWWIGTSMISSVPYAIVRVLEPLFGSWAPRDGFGGLYAVVLAWITVALAAACALIAWRLMSYFTRVTAGVAFLAIGAVTLGTPLFWYTYRFPLGTHVAAAFAIAMLVFALFRADRDDAVDGLVAGLAAGLAIATRIQHVVLLPAVLYAVTRQRRNTAFWRNAIVVGALPIVCQAIAWQAVYGTPLGPIARGATLGGTTWMPFRNLAFLTVLTTSYHGLLSWSPLVALSIVGWCLATRDPQRRTIAVTFLLMFAAEWFANGTLDRYFWGGMSFGARRFVDLAVPFMLGLAWLLERAPRPAAIASAVLTLWSVALMAAAHARAISLARYVGGGELVAEAMSPATWWRAVAAPMHSPVGDPSLLLQSVVAGAILVSIAVAAMKLPLRHRALCATAVAALCVIAAAFCALRTPQRAHESATRLQVDVERSRRFGALVDQRGLLSDELSWAEATGRRAAAAGTRDEIARIDAILDELARR